MADLITSCEAFELESGAAADNLRLTGLGGRNRKCAEVGAMPFVSLCVAHCSPTRTGLCQDGQAVRCARTGDAERAKAAGDLHGEPAASHAFLAPDEWIDTFRPRRSTASCKPRAGSTRTRCLTLCTAYRGKRRTCRRSPPSCKGRWAPKSRPLPSHITIDDDAPITITQLDDIELDPDVAFDESLWAIQLRRAAKRSSTRSQKSPRRP